MLVTQELKDQLVIKDQLDIKDLLDIKDQMVRKDTQEIKDIQEPKERNCGILKWASGKVSARPRRRAA